MQYLISIDRAVKGFPNMWKKHYSIGNLKVIEFDKKKRYFILRLENFNLHPILCQIFRGVFASPIQIVVGNEVACEERKCVFKGDEYHEFLVKW